MSPFRNHRGISFSVDELDGGFWKWAIHPPESVTDFRRNAGTVKGKFEDAVAAAKREIEIQDMHNAN